MARDCKVQRPLCLNGALPLVKWIMNPPHSCEKRVSFSPNVLISYLIAEDVCQPAPQQVPVAEERRKMLSSGTAFSGEAEFDRLSNSEHMESKTHEAQEARLPAPLTENILEDVLREVGQGYKSMIDSCLHSYKLKRISAPDVLDILKSMKSHSKTLAAIFATPVVEDAGEEASADDFAELMALSGMSTSVSDKSLKSHTKTLAAILEVPAEDTGEEASADDLAELMALSGMSTPFAQSPTVSSLANDKICPDNLMLAVPVLEASYAERDPDEECDRFMNALVQWSSVVRFRPFRGKVIITARASQKEGIPGLLCFEKGGLSVVGGADLDETFLSMPLQYAKINVVPDCDDKFQISVSGSHGLGIFVVVRDRSVRDQWLASLSAIPDMKIDGWRPSPLMARDCKVQRPLCLNGALPLVKWIS
jgi:hypothetical protein